MESHNCRSSSAGLTRAQVHWKKLRKQVTVVRSRTNSRWCLKDSKFGGYPRPKSGNSFWNDKYFDIVRFDVEDFRDWKPSVRKSIASRAASWFQAVVLERWDMNRENVEFTPAENSGSKGKEEHEALHARCNCWKTSRSI